jgi:dTDP-glucose 4,6-dehydratase
VPKTLLITGGAGFIGSALVRHLMQNSDYDLTVVDALTYAGSLETLASVGNDPRLRIVRLDILDEQGLASVFEQCDPDIVVHLAAETHVDRSIDGPGAFVRTNVVGTYVMLQTALAHWRRLSAERREKFRFHHVSTDEVFGALGDEGAFREDTRYDPRSPYAATKASSDHIVRAWGHTYGLPYLITNCSNNFGPFQYPEKLIPLSLISALEGAIIPVYGEGRNIRDWLYVDDHVRALTMVFERGQAGQTFNIGGSNERTTLEVVTLICDVLDAERPRPDRTSYAEQIRFVPDRPGHDYRYAIDATRIRREVGWTPAVSFERGMQETVRWYLTNADWWRTLRHNANASAAQNVKRE